ncbi:MAG: universal stress protein [Roseitalea sp.]|nr:universal stress protein [Roseitalea sp.]MBO6722695.1 universal stress protein [Roseitalea sp.]MBO6744470.1 universal stress protein [Roseitalea sp.]
MYKMIAVPVDLAHADKLKKAIDTSADLAKLYGAQVTYIGVTAAAPGSGGHNPDEYRTHLDAFAAEQAKAHGIGVATHAVVSHDPAANLDRDLLAAVDEIGADLVVMASHTPGAVDRFWHLWPSHGGAMATHATASVFVVR